MSAAFQAIVSNWIEGSNYLSIRPLGNIYVPEVLNFSVHHNYVFLVLEMSKDLCRLFPVVFSTGQKAMFYDKMSDVLEKTWMSHMFMWA